MNNASLGSIVLSYDLANRLKTMSTTTYSNNAAGERTSKTDTTNAWTYIYDGESRLTKVTKNGANALDNAYDGSGMRIKQVSNGKTTYYIYQGNNPLMEYSLNDQNYTYFIYAGNKLVADEKVGVVRYYHPDHLGSTRVITDATGSVKATYTFKPYGEIKSHGGSDTSKYTFTGKESDINTGLSYFGARWYDPEVGRFITQDPAKDGLNWYAYCNNNPLKNVDPSGNTSISANYLLNTYSNEISQAASRYNISSTLLRSVVWNENKYRNIVHGSLDVAALTFKGKASLGICQMQMTTAAFLNTNPDPESLKGISNNEFEERKREAFNNLNMEQKKSLEADLMNPEINLDYAAKYLSLIQNATGSTNPENTLSNYNRGPNSWDRAPSSYGEAYVEYNTWQGQAQYSWTNLFTPSIN